MSIFWFSQMKMEYMFQFLLLVFAVSMVITQVAQLFAQNVKQSAKRNNLAMPVLLAWALLFSSCTKQTLSEEAKRDLEPFFRTLFTKSEFAYTLFGDKPMSFYSYFYRQPNCSTNLASQINSQLLAMYVIF